MSSALHGSWHFGCACLSSFPHNIGCGMSLSLRITAPSREEKIQRGPEVSQDSSNAEGGAVRLAGKCCTDPGTEKWPGTDVGGRTMRNWPEMTLLSVYTAEGCNGAE